MSKHQKQVRKPQDDLLPYAVIQAATAGDPDAIAPFCAITAATSPICRCERSMTSRATPIYVLTRLCAANLK